MTGEDTRWRFSEITPDAFRWTGKVKADDGDWQLQQSDLAIRRA